MDNVMILTIKTKQQTELIDITSDVSQLVRRSGIEAGICLLYVPHTTAAVTINESADPSVRADILMVLNDIIPWKAAYRHLEGNSPAHIKSSLVGASEMIAVEKGRLVLGTGNRTEWLLGYTTLHGDEACGLNPLGQLYKTEIRLLADHLGLPREVLTKAPSADLWEGQADEDELGFSYADADRLLHHLVDEGLAPRQLEALGFAPALIGAVAERMAGQAFKRRLPPVCSFERPAPE